MFHLLHEKHRAEWKIVKKRSFIRDLKGNPIFENLLVFKDLFRKGD